MKYPSGLKKILPLASALAAVSLALYWMHENPNGSPATGGSGAVPATASSLPPPPPGTLRPLVVTEPVKDGLMNFARQPDGALRMGIPAKGAPENQRVVEMDRAGIKDFSAIAEGSQIPFPLPDAGRTALQVNYSRADEGNPKLWLLGGEFADKSGTFYFAQNSDEGLVSGWVARYNDANCWVLASRGGVLTLEETLTSSVVCIPPGQVGIGAPDNGSGGPILVPGGPALEANDPPPTLSSSNATSVLYIDFEGGSVTNAFWNAGNAITYESAGLERATMSEIHTRVAEDYKPFDVNVTTDRTKYTAAPVGRRMRIIVSRTQWHPTNISGFAAVSSFPNAGGFSSLRAALRQNAGWDPNSAEGVANPIAFPTDIMAWMFTPMYYQNWGQTPADSLAKREISNAITHELGHALGLLHDSTTAFDSPPGVANSNGEYYGGAGTGENSFAPLMGNYLTRSLAQWSKGDYPNAVNRGVTPMQDDIAIIANVVSAGGNGLVDNDGRGSSIATAALLNIVAGGAVADSGVIFSATDEDFFRIPIVATGFLDLEINAETRGGNLDVYAELLDSSGTLILGQSFDNNRNARIKRTTALAPGNYYLKVRGNEGPDWPRYGSIGTYLIGGSVTGSGGAPEITAAGIPPSGNVGVAYSFPITATNNPTSYYLVSGAVPPGLLLSSGALSGTPTQAGEFNFTLAAANGQGGTSKFFTIYIYGAVDLPGALDNSALTWNTRSLPSSTVASTLWQGQKAITQDGTDAARSGTSGANSESILETEVRGPGTLTFYWRTSSHSGDRLWFSLDNADQYNISGETGWAQRTVTIGNGTHFPRWIYRTDPGTTSGENAGFVDRVVYTASPIVTNSPLYAAGMVGQPFNSKLLISETTPATGFTLVSGPLPPGVSFNTATGEFSGTPATAGQWDLEINVTNAGGSTPTFPTLYVYPNILLSQAVDANGLTWVTGGTNPWFGDSALTHDGTDAAHSGPIRHNRNSFMQTTVTGPGTFTFWWKCSTEATGDPVAFSLDGTVQESISGEVDWAQRSISISSGAHTLRWEYTRNGSGNGGSNMAWVDQVGWATPGPTITSPLTVNWTCGQVYNVNLTSDDPAATWSVNGTIPADMFFFSDSNNIAGVPKLPRVVTLTVNATNAGGTTTSRTFTANIESSYAAWARARGLAAGTPNDDTDKDGLSNFAECAYAFNPTVKDPPFQPVTYNAATKRLRAIFKRRQSYFPDVKYEVQVSSNLQTWQTIAVSEGGSNVTNIGAQSVAEVQTNPFPDPIMEVTVIDGIPQSPTATKRHMRLKITQL